jgi:hypothetical protein
VCISRWGAIALLPTLALSGCHSAYWISADNAYRARNGSFSELAGVPATRADDGRAVCLSPSALEGVDLGLGDAPVRVRPEITELRRYGYIVLGIGAVLAVGAGIAGATANQPGCHDEGCWFPQLTAGLTFGTLGAVLLATGGAMAIAGSAER